MPKSDLKKIIHDMYKKAGIKKGRNTKELYKLTNTYFRNLVYQVYVTRNLATGKVTLRSVDVTIVKYVRGEKY